VHRDLCIGIAALLLSQLQGMAVVAEQHARTSTTAAVASQPVATGEDQIDLFNGKDLTHWVVEGTQTTDAGQPVWSVRQGLIDCAGSGFGFLRYDRLWDDFALSLQFRLDRGVNSGVGIRGTKYTGDRQTRPSFAGFEVQLIDDADRPPSANSTGSLYRYVAPQAAAAKPAGQWNDLPIECRGPRIKVVLNGKVVQNLDQHSMKKIADKPLKGYVSLQNHGGHIQFRDVQLTAARRQ
jgi:hypothetical protein